MLNADSSVPQQAKKFYKSAALAVMVTSASPEKYRSVSLSQRVEKKSSCVIFVNACCGTERNDDGVISMVAACGLGANGEGVGSNLPCIDGDEVGVGMYYISVSLSVRTPQARRWYVLYICAIISENTSSTETVCIIYLCHYQ
jgi:hypothetical protein